MTPVKEIWDALVEVLGSELGTYTFPSGQSTPAIRIEDGSSPYTEEPSVQGLEVVIQSSIDVPIQPLLDGYQQTFSHLVQLKQWDIEKTTLDYMSLVMGAMAQFDTLSVDRVNRQIRLTKLDNIERLSFVVSERVLVYAEY